MIRQIKAITRAETAQLFFSPVAWLVIVLFSFQAYSNFTSNLLGIANDQDMYGMVPNISKELFSGIRGLFPSVLNYLYLYMPIVTMGLMSKEISSGSIKLLYSSPVTPFQIIFGKFRSMAIFSAILTAVLLPGIIFAAFTVDNIDFGLIISGLCGVYLTLCAYSAIGLFMSALTGYQIVAALLTLGAFSFLEQLGSLGQNVEFLRPATYWASISGRADALIEGLVSSEDVAYFILVIGLFLSFSVFLLQYRRDRNKWLCAAKYVGSTVIVLIVGVLTSNPWLTVYYDATRNDDNTITDTSRELIERLEGPLDITTYVNLSDYSAWLGAPSSINDDIKRYKQFMRFKPDINMEYVYFYDEPYANEDYGVCERGLWCRRYNACPGTGTEIRQGIRYSVAQGARARGDKGYGKSCSGEQYRRQAVGKRRREADFPEDVRRLHANPGRAGDFSGCQTAPRAADNARGHDRAWGAGCLQYFR